MNIHHSAVIALHWFWTAFFIGFGIYLIAQKGMYGVSGLCRRVRLASEDSAENQVRIDDAIARRRTAEGEPPPVGLWTGIISIALGVIAWFTQAPAALLYAVLCLAMSFGTAAAYLRLRNSQPKRVALLVARTQGSVIPLYWFAIAVIAGLCVLTYLNNTPFAIAAVAVCCSTLLSTAIAWRLTQLPAMLSDLDIAADRVIDDRLRFVRSGAVLMYALIQPFFFCSQIPGHQSPVQIAAEVFSSVIWVAFMVWMMRRQSSKSQIVAA